MNDTKPSVEGLWRGLLLQRSGSERVAMGCSMFDDAQSLVLAGLRASSPELDARGLKRLMFLRFYGSDFPAAKLGKILKGLLGRS